METLNSNSQPPTSFKCDKINKTTFVIIEDDIYHEYPFIYVKVYVDPALIVLSDTGCGGRKGSHDDTLRNFIETYPIKVNGYTPLNPRDDNGIPLLNYLIICTHCHFDHILGITEFLDISPIILASAHGRLFIESDLAEHSLCHYIGVPTPAYSVSYWASDMQNILYDKRSLQLEILHTPGHTPDELAWYDSQERHIYVGDTFYERVAEDKSYTQAIVFPKEGNLIDYMQTLEKLLSFVKERNADGNKSRVKLGCGHITASVDALEILVAVQKFFHDILAGIIPVIKSVEKRGEVHDLWQEAGDPRFSVIGPRRLVLDARKHFQFEPFPDANFHSIGR